MNTPKKLIIGGCRSGKSRYAEQWVETHFPGTGPDGTSWKLFIASLEATDDAEMNRRIAQHRARRGTGWRCVEEPLDLAGVLQKNDKRAAVILVDCLTLWLSNMLLRDFDDSRIEAAVENLMVVVSGLSVPVLLVANEVGLGLVPENPLGRRFRDLAGWTNQRMATVCNQVVLVAAGLPLFLKGRL